MVANPRRALDININISLEFLSLVLPPDLAQVNRAFQNENFLQTDMSPLSQIPTSDKHKRSLSGGLNVFARFLTTTNDRYEECEHTCIDLTFFSRVSETTGTPEKAVLHDLRSLHATLRRRLSMLFVFSTALVALAASIAKTVITFQIFGGGIPGDLLLADSQQTFMWVLEAGFAIIAVNLPTLVWLRSAKAPEQMLASVRSFLSIGNRSNKSAGSSSFRQGSDGNTTYRTGSVQPHQGATVLNGGDLGFVPNTNVARESHATFQKEASQHIPLPEHGIQVTNDIVQKYETV